MATKILLPDATGMASMFRYHGVIRLTSHVSYGGIEGPDFERGYDQFWDANISDEDLGREIRMCCDTTRFISYEDSPKPLDNRRERKLMQEWHRKAFRHVGVKDLAELWGKADFVRISRSNAFYLFLNGQRLSMTHIANPLDHEPDYWEAVLYHPVSDLDLGRTARDALDHMSEAPLKGKGRNKA